MRSRNWRWVGIVGVVLFASVTSSPAHGQEAASADGAESGGGDIHAACGKAYETAQEARADGKLQEAVESLVTCAQTDCPAFIQTDCTAWLDEVRRELPSVVIAAVGADGEETAEVQISVDGKVLAENLDGRAFPINPGVHHFVFKYKELPPIERRIVVRQGQQNRTIRISFAATKPVLEAPPDAAPPPVEKPFFQRHRSEIRLGSYIGAGVGAAAFVPAAIFWVLGKNEEDRFLADCGEVIDMRCVNFDYSDPETQTRILQTKSNVSTQLTVGNVSAIAGGAVLALAVTAYLLTEPWADEANDESDSEASDGAFLRDVQVSGGPTSGGAVLGLSGRF